MSKIQAIKIGKALVYGFKPTSQLTFIKEEVGKRTLNGKEIAYVKMPKQIQIEVVLPYGSIRLTSSMSRVAGLTFSGLTPEAHV